MASSGGEPCEQVHSKRIVETRGVADVFFQRSETTDRRLSVRAIRRALARSQRRLETMVLISPLCAT